MLFNCEVWAVIKFLNVEGVTGLEIHRRLSNVYGAGNVMSLCHIYKWIWFFLLGRATHMMSNKLVVCDSVRLDQWWNNCSCVLSTCERSSSTFSDIHQEMAECYLKQTNRTTIFRILTEELEMRKVIAPWVLRMLKRTTTKIALGQDKRCWHSVTRKGNLF